MKDLCKLGKTYKERVITCVLLPVCVSVNIDYTFPILEGSAINNLEI